MAFNNNNSWRVPFNFKTFGIISHCSNPLASFHSSSELLLWFFDVLDQRDIFLFIEVSFRFGLLFPLKTKGANAELDETMKDIDQPALNSSHSIEAYILFDDFAESVNGESDFAFDDIGSPVSDRVGLSLLHDPRGLSNDAALAWSTLIGHEEVHNFNAGTIELLFGLSVHVLGHDSDVVAVLGGSDIRNVDDFWVEKERKMSKQRKRKETKAKKRCWVKGKGFWNYRLDLAAQFCPFSRNITVELGVI